MPSCAIDNNGSVVILSRRRACEVGLGGDNSFWFAHRNEVIATVIQRFPPSGPIYDVGGGNGFVSKGLIEHGFCSIVVEPDSTGIAVSKSRGVHSVRGVLQDLPDAGADAIGMFDVLEHIEDDIGTLCDVRSKLKPGGLYYVAVPTYSWLWSEEDEFSGHFRRYTRMSLTKKLKAQGFQIKFQTYFFLSHVPGNFCFLHAPFLVF